MLNTMDRLWVHHLTALDEMRQGAGLQGYGGRDPLVVYKGEAHDMWQQLMEHIRQNVVRSIYRVNFTQPPAAAPQRAVHDQPGQDGQAATPLLARRRPPGGSLVPQLRRRRRPSLPPRLLLTRR